MSRPLTVVFRLFHSLFVGQPSSPVMNLHEAAGVSRFAAGTAAVRTESESPEIQIEIQRAIVIQQQRL